MGRVLKYISVFGGVQGLNVLFSIVRNKLTSVLLGVGGVGLIDVYSRTADLIGSSTNFGLSFSAVQLAYAVDVQEVGGDARNLGAHSVEHRAELLYIRLAGGVVYRDRKSVV